ncbi:MAG TPA: helix-turn-helix transcriptional regulator [Chitinophagales bacterium]|nr:helix-turn-helix transcriptional regulator [Chitinophagales bacterium]
MSANILIAKRIRELREERNLTQEELAWKSEVNRTFMNHVENGRRNISIETLEKILNGLDISFTDFFSSEKFHGNKKKRK